MIFHYCLVDDDLVVGARLNLDMDGVRELALWMQDDPRIAGFDNLTMPCELRLQLEAILETEARMKREKLNAG